MLQSGTNGEGGRRGCRPKLIDKSRYRIKCKYWGRLEIGWKDVKDWTELLCRYRRQGRATDLVLRRCYEVKKYIC